MALDLESEYPGKVTAADANYPYGSAKNETVVDAFDGTPWEKAILNDVLGLEQSLLNAAGIVPSGNADTVVASQYMQSILYQLLTGTLFVDSGAADAYVLAPLTNNYAPAAYKDGAKYRWIVGNTNTGASTINISTLGVKDIVLDGVALGAGALVLGDTVEITFDNANDRFELTSVSKANTEARGLVELATDAEVATGTDTARVPSVSSMGAHEGVVKGWVNMDGTGTIAIRDSFNVSSIVDNGVGDYTINWDTDFADTNYCVAIGSDSDSTTGGIRNWPWIKSVAVGSVQIGAGNSVGVNELDTAIINLIAIGDQ